MQPSKFVEAVGRRAALLGREDGTFEAWLMPIKALRDFRLAVYFDGSLEPLPLAEMAERVVAGPGRVTITHSHAAFTIRQTFVADLDRPVILVLLDIETGRPLRLRASFMPEMRPMWPASLGGQSSSWDEAEKALVLTEPLGRFAAVVGSPLFSRHSEQIGHQLPDRTVLVEMDITPETARRSVIPIVIAGSGSGTRNAVQLYREALAKIPELVAASDAYYKDFLARSIEIETPDPALNRAFDWAKVAVDKGWQCNEGIGCGLVAGFGPSGASERPGFAWYFGGDALMNSWSIVDYGDFGRARAALEFLRGRQRDDGKMMHELPQSAALLDWSCYPYGYYHADTTPLYLFSSARYVARSGDREFLRQSWPSLEKAFRYCVSTLDDDGLMSNRKAGAAAVETGALSGRVAQDAYLEGVWLAALDAYAK
ncbi:MAG: amylo-alpha-1,6-glucosidase, partial [Acidobacteria bacterium]|nr:amylo-alpha-1,6-glucosidase [Acidobacteriota bacterium]